jgi:hypothetical protein
MAETANDQLWQYNPAGNVLVSSTSRIVSDAEIERRDARNDLRSRLPLLRAWSLDTKSAEELTAMTAAQRLARQAVIENRVALLSRLVFKLIWQIGEDDGS